MGQDGNPIGGEPGQGMGGRKSGAGSEGGGDLGGGAGGAGGGDLGGFGGGAGARDLGGPPADDGSDRADDKQMGSEAGEGG